jgi:hypothetical protein
VKTRAATAKRGPGRPVVGDEPARKTFQLRVSDGQRAPWRDAAEKRKQGESEWAREGLDAWARVNARAAELNTDPDLLFDEALEAHARVRAVVDELRGKRALTEEEARIFRLLAPRDWQARVERGMEGR